MKTSWILFDRWHGRKIGAIGSSVIRGRWLIPHWPESKIWTHGDKADMYIFQKVYWPSFAKDCQAVKILDLCDPDWFNVKNNLNLVEYSQYMDAITCSSQELVDLVKRYVKIPVYYVPDRVDPDIFGEPKIHTGKIEKIAWFGYAHNAQDLFKDGGILSTLAPRGIKLKIISEQEWQPTGDYGLEVENGKFNWDSLSSELKECDLVINPRPAYQHYRFKSNNKTLIAWANGLPVAETLDDLAKFNDPIERINEKAKRLKEIEEKWHIKYSIKEYKDIYENIARNK